MIETTNHSGRPSNGEISPSDELDPLKPFNELNERIDSMSGRGCLINGRIAAPRDSPMITLIHTYRTER